MSKTELSANYAISTDFIQIKIYRTNLYFYQIL